MSRRVAMYYSGAQWQLDLFQFDKYRKLIDRLVYAPDLSIGTLASFDIFLVPRESNQELLYERRHVIEGFLAGGGTIVSFGEIVRPWLPGVEWKSGAPRFVYDGENAWDKGYLDNQPLSISDPNHPAFRDLEIDDLTWHFHGALVPPDGANVLLQYGSAQVIAFEHYPRTGGRIFAATLDPVLHAGYGGVSKTQKFLDAVLRWVRGESASGRLIAVGTDEAGEIWSDHFGIAPYYLLFDDTGTCIDRRCNPYATNADGTTKHHGNPRLIIELLKGSTTWIGKRIGEGGDARRYIAEQAGIEIVPTESENAAEAVQTYVTAHKERV
jgi:hypothetical protein